jgi:hypothetical protein
MNYLRLAGQFAVILLLFASVAALADRPVYRQIPPGHGVVMLTFVHSAERLAECRRLSAQEIAKLPPNMRRAQDCPRGRRPVYVELEIDGRPVYRANLPPSGIASDGPSRVYERFVLPEGDHDLAVRMRDTGRSEGFDHESTRHIALASEQMLVIDFRAETGGFVFR